jgi:hypothetical protein
MDLADRVRVPLHATLLDGRRKYLIPGLGDMHVHSLSDSATATTAGRLLLVNGVTGVRDMAGPLRFVWRRRRGHDRHSHDRHSFREAAVRATPRARRPGGGAARRVASAHLWAPLLHLMRSEYATLLSQRSPDAHASANGSTPP